jgi:hypothetical protein
MTDADKDRKLAFYDETSDLLRRGPAGYRLEVVYGDDDKLQLRHFPTQDVLFAERVRNAAQRLGEHEVVGVRLNDQNLLVIVADAVDLPEPE